MTESKTVLITGAGKRIGREIALFLASRGWDVAIHYHRSQKEAAGLARLIEKQKRKAYLVQADLQDSKAVACVIPSLVKKGVRLDALINNAAVFLKGGLTDLNEKDWRLHTDVNLFAPLQLSRDFAAQYKGSAGAIINITDGLNGWSLSPTFLSYSISKTGLANATELLALALAPTIRVNAIAPGPTLEGPQDKKETFAKLKKIIPLKRTNSVGEVCGAVAYLLGASSVTGQIITLSGGMHLSK